MLAAAPLALEAASSVSLLGLVASCCGVFARVDRRSSANPRSNRVHAVGLVHVRPKDAVATRLGDQPHQLGLNPSTAQTIARHSRSTADLPRKRMKSEKLLGIK